MEGSVWLSVLKRVYPALSRVYPAIVGGSQVFYVAMGLLFPSKDIDLFIEAYDPLRVAEIASKSVGMEGVRFEAFTSPRSGLVTHVYLQVGGSLVVVEVLSRTHLGAFTGSVLGDYLIHVERDGVAYTSISPELYAVLQATRPEGVRGVDVERFRLVKDNINWREAASIAEELGVAREFRVFRERVVGGL